MSAVGIVVNPWAGKDVRRLHGNVGHSPDTAKIGIVRRVAVAALEAGVERVLVACDAARICARAIAGVDGAELLDGAGTGSALDTRRAAAQFADLGCRPVVVLGGDGTCRDVVTGWPDVTMIAVSTGTNNVFPQFVDGTSAGTAAGLIACGAVDDRFVGRQAKRLVVEVERPGRERSCDVALVDVALIDGGATGARAVLRPGAVRAVVAAIATPASTGLSSIAGRVHPMSADGRGAVVVRLGGTGPQVRVPLVAGVFDTVSIAHVEVLQHGGSVRFTGPGVLAYDGERDRLVPDDGEVTITVDRNGPTVIDVERALRCAAEHDVFVLTMTREAPDGD